MEPMTSLATYPTSLGSLLALATLVVAQVVVATAAARRAGETPGMAPTLGHASFTFRAYRAHQNTLENLPAFVTALVAAMGVGAAPVVVESAALAFVGARFVHAGAYYAGVEPVRTAAFGVGLLCILSLVAASGVALL